MLLRTPHMLALGALMFVFQILLASSASAHHPTITADAVCDPESGLVFIDYVSTAWEGNPDDLRSRENPLIEIYLEGVLADSGAYAAPDYSFYGSLPAPMGAMEGDILTLTALAAAPWGNGRDGGQSSGTTVVVPGDCVPDLGTGRFTGGGHQIRVDGVRVTRGLTIHCDLLLSNNLEINWNGNSFHMTEHMTTVICSDDPNIGQAPPPAPLDTLIGVGTGRYNGDDGFTIDFTLVDGGEPGGDDQSSFLIYETANPANVILDVPLQNLSGGNLQAHYDQPHR